jgi:radical SAM superfamily enzyme YgiQ (UPF0313 family)
MSQNRKKRVLLIQLPMPQFAYHKQWGNIPLAAGYLKTSALKLGLSNLFDIEILDTKSSCLESDARLIKTIANKRPDVLGFTLYYWNGLRSLSVAGRVKSLLPDTKVLVGGPEVTLDSEYILKDKTVDMGCIGQGERTFVEMLKATMSGDDYSGVPGIFHRVGDRVIVNTPGSPFERPEEVPSPYLSGVIDPRDYERAWLETQRGCPFQCKYCTWKIQSPITFPVERILDEVRLFKKRGIRQVKVLNGSFILAPNFAEICKGIKEINKDRQLSFVVYVPAEQIDKKKAELLRDINCIIANVGLQSVSREALSNVSRTFDAQKFLKGYRLLADIGIKIEIDTIIGLPGDTLKGFTETIDFIKNNTLDASPNSLLFFMLSMMPGAPLRREAEQYGIEYDPLPPYHIKGTKTMPSCDLEAARDIANNLHVYTQSRRRNHCFSMVTTCHRDVEYARPIQSRDICRCTKELPASVSKMVVHLDRRRQTPAQWKTVSEGLRDHIRQPFTAWFKTASLDRDVELIHSFCTPLFESNPYLMLRLWIETDSVFSFSNIDFIKKMIPVKERFYWTVIMPQALQVGVILPWSSANYDREWLAQATNRVDLFWRVRISAHEDWKGVLRGIMEDTVCCGILIEVDDDIPMDERAAVLHYVHAHYQKTSKLIGFRDLELESTLLCLDESNPGYTTFKPWYVESILTLDTDLSVGSLYCANEKTYQDLTAYQLLVQRKMKKSKR